MNMSGNYTGQYYQPFRPPNQPFGQPNQPYRQPSFPPNYPRDYNPMYPPNFHQPPQNFAEYSLWGSSPYIPSELIHPARNGSGMWNQRPSPPYPPPVQFRPELHEEPEPMSPVPPDVTHTDEDAAGGSEEPELTGLEEVEKTVIEKDELYKCPDDDDVSDIEENPDTVEQASNSSGSSAGDWTHSNFQRAGAYPPSYPWASRPARVVNNRGKKANIMQRRLVRALSQPVKMDKGASMMQRMGWMGGGLGRDESGIVDPVAPNAVYASSTVGFGQEAPKTQPAKKKQPKGPLQPHIKKKKSKKVFKTNLLKFLLDFVKNDLMLELYFDTKLMSGERKRIHRLVSALDGREQGEELDTLQQQEIINDIHRRNHYSLTTQSEGEGRKRQICVYKSAPNHMFLVTPDDCRPCITEIKEIEEDSNPFLKSITKHIKKDEGTILKPKPPHLFDKLVEFFIDFCADEGFTEFRFLGPFTNKEVNVINNFFSLIGDLANKQKPCFKCPVELLDVFATDFRFHADSDPNGFNSIKKMPFNLKKEFEKQQLEKSEKKT